MILRVSYEKLTFFPRCSRFRPDIPPLFVHDRRVEDFLHLSTDWSTTRKSAEYMPADSSFPYTMNVQTSIRMAFTSVMVPFR